VLTRTVDEDGFRVDGTGQSVALQWQGIHSIVETSEFMLVFPNESCGYYIPKRLVPSPEELESLRQLLRARLGQKAELTGPLIASAA
jgi:YcxB-like protein